MTNMPYNDSENLRELMDSMIASGKFKTDEALLVIMANLRDVRGMVKQTTDLPFVKFLVFIKGNKTIGKLMLLLSFILFGLWQIPAVRYPLMLKMGIPPEWLIE